MKILYVARCGIPNTAPGIRIYNIAKVLEALGYEVDFLCRQENDISSESIIQYDNFTYYFSKGLEDKRGLAKIKKKIDLLFDVMFAKKTYSRMFKDLDLSKYDGVILYNDTIALTKRLLKDREKMGFKLFADVTEWYEIGNGRTLIGSLVGILTDIRIKRYDKQLNGVIAISGYLHNYYKGRNINTIFVPPIFHSSKKINKTTIESDEIIITYAGSPGVKDILKPIIDSVASINKVNTRIKFNIIGIDEKYLFEKYYHRSGEYGVFAYGRVNNDYAKEIISNSDFTVLFRKPLRYAKAGYSTKLAESLMLGIPVLCNEVGGADIHIKTGFNGVKIKDYSKENIENMIYNISIMPKSEIAKMKENAYSLGIKLYNPQQYMLVFENFIN